MLPPDAIACTTRVSAFAPGGVEPESEVETQLSAWSASSTKRAFDVALVLLFSPALVPLLFLIAAAVWLSSPGPVIFRQSRIGRFGKPFMILKFRTMFHSDSDPIAVVASAAAGQITNLGRFLRWLKLDELPQCINVLRGDMSLVGPRPKIAEQQIGTFDCRPGITGAATLAFAREESLLRQIPPQSLPHFYRENVLPVKQQLDSEYMARATLLSDLRLLLLTAAGRWETSILESHTAPVIASAWAASAPAQTSLPPSS
jgi:lipopolysaccharide/colanic/teichoic acid biosynthesis glycosyltransferase